MAPQGLAYRVPEELLPCPALLPVFALTGGAADRPAGQASVQGGSPPGAVPKGLLTTVVKSHPTFLFLHLFSAPLLEEAVEGMLLSFIPNGSTIPGGLRWL